MNHIAGKRKLPAEKKKKVYGAHGLLNQKY
jgi:hypothetical protein